MQMDLLAPQGAEEQLRQNYVHQLTQTINAYRPAHIFLGEALQNALDAVREAGGREHDIKVQIDLDERTVTVTDDGVGFPDKPALLFLGGGTKIGKGFGGLVGVGLKVVLFSSEKFTLRSTTRTKNMRVELREANRFADTENPPKLTVPDHGALPEDPDPLYPTGTGTFVEYKFPVGVNGVPERFFRDVAENCLEQGTAGFENSLANAASKGGYPNRLAALLASFLRRYTYLGATQVPEAFPDTTVWFELKAESGDCLGELADLRDGKNNVTFAEKPGYLTVAETLSWDRGRKPVVRSDPLGDGGANLSRVELGFNVTRYETADDFKLLLAGSAGRTSRELDRFEKNLFPKLNSVTVTLGRIPQFLIYLPGGAQRVISARGTVTGHDIPISSGQNQQYVRCLDIVVDVDADLNYGKTQLTDMHLVGNVRKYLNEAYRLTLQNAAKNLVGKSKPGSHTDDKFWERPVLSIDEILQKRQPRDENDVIALLFELTGRGHLNNFRWFGLSSKDTYDARALIKRNSDPQSMLDNPDKSDLRVVEFKLRGASVARDFNQGAKQAARVDLVICWEIGVSPVGDYLVVDLADSNIDKSTEGAYPGVTHVLMDAVTGFEVQLFPLQTFMETLYSTSLEPLPDDVEDAD